MVGRNTRENRAVKRALVALLAGLNVVLLVALLSTVYSGPAAYGQMSGGGGDLACFVAKPLGQTFDVHYVLDTRERKLFSFFPSGVPTRQFHQAPPRDLAADFGRGK